MANESQIFKALQAIMAEVSAIEKSSFNSTQNYKFRGIDAVMNELHRLMVKHQVLVLPEIKEHHAERYTTAKGGGMQAVRVKVEYTFTAADGSTMRCTMMGEGMDSGDKATNKAMSAALKYALLQVFMIPTKEMTDPDATSPQLPPQAIDGVAYLNIAACATLEELTALYKSLPADQQNTQLPYFTERKKALQNAPK